YGFYTHSPCQTRSGSIISARPRQSTTMVAGLRGHRLAPVKHSCTAVRQALPSIPSQRAPGAPARWRDSLSGRRRRVPALVAPQTRPVAVGRRGVLDAGGNPERPYAAWRGRENVGDAQRSAEL